MRWGRWWGCGCRGASGHRRGGAGDVAADGGRGPGIRYGVYVGQRGSDDDDRVSGGRADLRDDVRRDGAGGVDAGGRGRVDGGDGDVWGGGGGDGAELLRIF